VRLGLAVLLLGCAARAWPAKAPPVQHTIELHIDPAARTFRGFDRVTLHVGAPSTFTIADGLTVDRITIDERPVAPTAGADAFRLDPLTEHALVLEYHGALAAPPDDGDIARPVGGPDGSYLPPATWYPAFDGPFTSSVTLDVPDPQRAATSGRLTAEETADGRYHATFVSDVPVVELAAFTGPYRIADRIHRGWRVRTYFHPDVAALSDTYLDHIEGYLDLYDGWIGTYPYAGFAVVSSPFPVGLGFPGLTYIGAKVLKLPFIPATSLGHEVLHSWWGTGVRPGSDGNWAEGLTTFMADYTFLEREGATPARDERLDWLREFAVLPAAEDRPLSAFQGRSHAASQATGYHKAAFVFIMLRDEIGADAFASAVRRFWQAFRFKSATWNDLEDAFSEAAKFPLGRFFQQWVQRPGAPDVIMQDARSDGPHVSFKLAQGAAPYSLAIPVRIETADTPITRTVRLDEPAREFAFEVTSVPRAVFVDPDMRLFRRLSPQEIPPIIRSVAFDADATTVVAAQDEAAEAAARAVAASLFGKEPAVLAAAESLPPKPVLVVGTTPEVAALLAKLGLDGPPAALDAKGTARAWAVRRATGAPLVVVAGNDVRALQAAAGPLPHYGRESFVVFDGARMIDRGLWEPAASPLRVQLAQ